MQNSVKNRKKENNIKKQNNIKKIYNEMLNNIKRRKIKK